MILVLIILCMGLVLGQMVWPPLPLVGVYPYLIPLPVAYAALRLGPLRASGVALGIGLLLDLYSGQRLGVSAVSLIVLVGFIWSQQENFKLDYAPHALLLTLLGCFLSGLVDYALFCWQVGQWSWPFAVLGKIVSQSFFSTLIAFPLFGVLNMVYRWQTGLAAPVRRPMTQRL
jgi:rod shape-determining protein MreD